MFIVRSKILLIVFCLLVSIRAVNADGEGTPHADNVASRVEAAFTLAAEGKDGLREARRRLEGLPAAKAIPVIVQTLQGHIAQRGDMRVLAYSILSYHEGAKTKEGYEQLIVGISDPAAEVQRICCGALGPETMAKELKPLHAQLVGRTVPENDKASIIDKIAGWGSYARASLESIEVIFADKTSGKRLRASAARAMLNIGGLERALKHFHNIDPEAERIAILHLLVFIMHTDEACHYQPKGKYREDRANARKLVLQTLKSANEDSRFAAIQALFNAFGTDFLVFHSSTQYGWNQEIRAALDALRNDPHPRIQKGVQEYFALDLDTAAKRMLRRKRRHEKRIAQEQQRQENNKSRP